MTYLPREEKVKGALLGAAVGDALGVPVEFQSRDYLRRHPVKDYKGYGTWNQPPGTFSDDASLLLCTAESLCYGFDLNDIAARFIQCYRDGYWSAHGEVFDVGTASRQALNRLISGISPLLSGGRSEKDNGNGSLMRLLPLVFSLQQEADIALRYDWTLQVSGITHAHVRSVMACFIYLELARALLNGQEKQAAYTHMQQEVNTFFNVKRINPDEVRIFNRVLQANITEVDAFRIGSSGYVVDTLESSLWCFLRSTSYSDAVLAGINLGDDTDTTGCVVGGLSGIYYGFEAIPTNWVKNLARNQDILTLASKLINRHGHG